jgi:hypothetical protein
LWMLVLSALARPTWMSLLTGSSCWGASIANLQFAFGCLCVHESSWSSSQSVFAAKICDLAFVCAVR